MSPRPETLELLTWIATRPRMYGETIEAWRSNCPHVAAWDDAVSDRLVRVVRDGRDSHVQLTPAGVAALELSLSPSEA